MRNKEIRVYLNEGIMEIVDGVTCKYIEYKEEQESTMKTEEK